VPVSSPLPASKQEFEYIVILIDHYIAPSRIHGLGVFAAEGAESGQKIWEFNATIDIVIPETALKELPGHICRHIQRRSEYYQEERVYILGSDGDAFMNHSIEPNLRSVGKTGFATRDIQIGDEITCDYRSTNVKDFTQSYGLEKSNAAAESVL
jgi:uncharacterized protein